MKIQQQKKLLRAEAKAELRALSPEIRSEQSRLIAQSIIKMPQFIAAETVFVYLARPFEADTAEIIEAALKSGKRVAAPRVNGGEMGFYYFDNATALVPGAFSIPEPPPDRPAVPKPGDFMAVPALLFSQSCLRLGNGGGYYDRYLEQHGDSLYTVGLSLSPQLKSDLPALSHDKALNAVATPNQILYKEN